MLFIRENEHKDMYFVCTESHDNNDRGGYHIVKVFYSVEAASEYIEDNQRINDG